MSGLPSLLLREPPLVVLPSLAVAVGLNEALLLQQIHFRSTTERGGDGWVRRTRKAWRVEFPFWSEDTIKRALRALRDRGLIEAEMVETADGREPRYRIVYEAVDQLAGGSGQFAPTPSGQSAPGGRCKSARPRSFKRGEKKLREEKPASQSSPSTSPDEDRDELTERRLRESVWIALGDRLARAMLANNPRARTSPRSRAWTEPIRMLLDHDGYDVVAVRAMIDWSQADDFERSIVLSPRSLRKGHERIVQKMRRAGVAPFGTATTPQSPQARPGVGCTVDDLQRRLREQAEAARAGGDVVDGTATEASS